MASTIYEPRGKAREYSPLALNPYSGCNHGCRYCYVPPIRRLTAKENLKVNARPDFLRSVKREAERMTDRSKQVLFSFMSDPYNELEAIEGLTRGCLQILLDNRIPVSILTKAGTKALVDMDLFKKFGRSIQVGATLTFSNDDDSRFWEPGAAEPFDRLEMLEALHREGIKTWASFEPVIDPLQSLELIENGLPWIDIYKIGKLNNAFPDIEKEICWPDFLEAAIRVLRKNKKAFYVKYDLRRACQGVKLYGNEVLQDEHNTPPFPALKRPFDFNGNTPD